MLSGTEIFNFFVSDHLKTNEPFLDATCLNMLCTIALLKHIQISSDTSFGMYFRKVLSLEKP